MQYDSDSGLLVGNQQRRGGGSFGFEGDLVGGKLTLGGEKLATSNWSSSFKTGDIILNPGISGGLGQGMSARKQWNVTQGTSEETEIELSTGAGKIKGIGMDGTINTNGTISYGASLKLALGAGFKGNVGLVLSLDKLKSALKPLTIPFTTEEKQIQNAPDTGTKDFDANNY